MQFIPITRLPACLQRSLSFSVAAFRRLGIKLYQILRRGTMRKARSAPENSGKFFEKIKNFVGNFRKNIVNYRCRVIT